MRRLAYEAADCGLLSADLAAGIRRVKGVKNLGVRLGNWLTAEQGHALWQATDDNRLKGKRDRAMLCLLLACGLRRHEVVALRVDHLQRREEHWAIVDLVGKGRHVRTVPIPDWVMLELNNWLSSAAIDRGKIFRRVSKMGEVSAVGMTPKVVWHIVKDAARRIGVAKSAPMTCAAHVPGSATRPGANWNRFSFCWGMFPFRPRNATWAASSGFSRRSMIESVLSLVHEDLTGSATHALACISHRGVGKK